MYKNVIQNTYFWPPTCAWMAQVDIVRERYWQWTCQFRINIYHISTALLLNTIQSVLLIYTSSVFIAKGKLCVQPLKGNHVCICVGHIRWRKKNSRKFTFPPQTCISLKRHLMETLASHLTVPLRWPKLQDIRAYDSNSYDLTWIDVASDCQKCAVILKQQICSSPWPTH